MKTIALTSLPLLALVTACAPSKTPGEPTAAAPPLALNLVPRADFNRLAAELSLPLFWRADDNGDGFLDAGELSVFWGLEGSDDRDLVAGKELSPKARAAYAEVAARYQAAPVTADPAEAKRQAALTKELAAGRMTLVETDLTTASPADKSFVDHIMKAAELVELIYERQTGSRDLAAKIPATDTLSRMVFFLNHGPWCSAPATENDYDCNALKDRPPRTFGLYPPELQKDKDFCKTLAAHKDAKALADPFVAVVKDAKGELVATPYAQAYKADMRAVSAELEAAAAAYPSGQEESLKAYLKAAAQAFVDNDWFKADEAWAKMTGETSKWYLRIGPDETYFEPCGLHAAFQVSFARVNPDSLKWQKRLDPVKADMEAVLAAHAGKPYKARQVAFHLPDFIDIVVNSGDARSPRGATIGESLPNFGPVANEGRGRTVVMTNFYTDPDSRAARRSQVESLLCTGSMEPVKGNAEPELMSTVLHEAAHNLGPSAQYKVEGKTDDETFGGPLAGTLEELKAQTAALFLTDWLVQKKVIDAATMKEAHTYDITWAFGHIAEGMYTAEHQPKTYSQLASIQVGFLLDKGAVVWNPDEPAASSEDHGCFELKLDKFPKAVDELTTLVFGIKARGDVKAAHALMEKYVDGPGNWEVLRTVIAERWSRSPRASFVYSVRR